MANPSLSLPKIYISPPLMANPSLSLPEMYISHPHQASFNRIICRTSVTCPPTQTSKITPMTTRTATTSSSLANVWRKIQGFDNWNGLLEPIHPILQSEIVRYGEFVTACYKAFDLDPSSKRYCKCKYGRNNMFKEVGMDNSGYEITKYIYATPAINLPTKGADSSSGRWIGYIAVSSENEIKRLGRRDILITFRGTVTNTEWIANFMSSLTPARLDPHDPRLDVKVEMGFLNLYTSSDSNCKFGHGSCREQLLSEVARVLNKYKEEEVSITLAGHSMGSSLAMLLAYDIAELGLNKSSCCGDVPITVYSFGGPRVGNNAFKERCEVLGVKVLRIVNVNDPITKLPGVLLNENFSVLGGRYELPWRTSCYAHVGVELVLDFFKMENPSCVHDLEAYLGLLRCPKGAVERSVGFLSQARQFATREKLNLWKLQNAMTNVGNLVQSLRI